MELPECPVCLQSYDGELTIPRVLACGHSVCQVCLVKLPYAYAQTIRCPACTQLVKYPPQGPSALPKNIDLLSYCFCQNPPENSNSINSRKLKDVSLNEDVCDFLPRFWSEEFYSEWKDWVLPEDAVLVDSVDEDERNVIVCAVLGGRIGSSATSSSLAKNWARFGEDQKVSLVKVSSLTSLRGSELEFSYFVRVMKCLKGMKEELKNELGLILRASVRQCRKVGRVYGLWGDLGNGYLYLVCERQNRRLLEMLDYLRDGLGVGVGGGVSNDWISAFAMVGMELCEAVIALHSEGLVTGCIGLSCFSFDDFGHVYVDLSEILMMGSKIDDSILEVVYGRMKIDGEKSEVNISDQLKDDAFVSPELLFHLLLKKGIAVECDKSKYPIGYSSDIWSLACLLLKLLLGEAFSKEFGKIGEVNDFDYLTLYLRWIDTISSLMETKLGAECASLKGILLKCLIYDPGSRPLLTDLRKCLGEFIVKSQFNILASLEAAGDVNSINCYIILGELCQWPKGKSVMSNGNELLEREVNVMVDFDHMKEERIGRSIPEGISQGMVESKDLQGHRDCVTGIAVGGGFLFTSSFDKTIRLWSLQDFSHVHTFEGHEHRVMAVIYVNQEQPMCISGDSGGGIFVWSLNFPLGNEPLNKWYEQKDWRYSGIRALCYSGNGYIYSGGGDKLIKAWSLQDCALLCSMSGHKSVVSTLAVGEGVLYSGSWDGTIRLWSLFDHNPLTVLGEETSGTASSVLSIVTDKHMLIAAYENGSIKVWKNGVYMKSMKVHNEATFAMGMEGRWLFTGGWGKTIDVHELSVDGFQIEARPVGSIPCDSVVTTALLCWQGKLFAGYADKHLKVYYCGG